MMKRHRSSLAGSKGRGQPAMTATSTATESSPSVKRVFTFSSPSSASSSSDNEHNRLQHNRRKKLRSSLKSSLAGALSGSESSEGARRRLDLDNVTGKKLTFTSSSSEDDDDVSPIKEPAVPQPAVPAADTSNPLLASTPLMTSPPVRGIRELRLHEEAKNRKKRASLTSPVSLPRPSMRPRLLKFGGQQVPSEIMASVNLANKLSPTPSGRLPVPLFNNPSTAAISATTTASSSAHAASPPKLLRGQMAYSRRRQSAPGGTAMAMQSPLAGGHFKRNHRGELEEYRSVKKSRYANINPFTPKPQALLDASLKNLSKDNNNCSASFCEGASGDQDCNKSTPNQVSVDPETAAADQAAVAFLAAMNGSRHSHHKSHDRSKESLIIGTPTSNLSIHRPHGWNRPNAYKSSPTTANFHLACGEPMSPPTSSRRLGIHDISISRFTEEFVEIGEIAAGRFGKVKVAKHRLDGMIYAVKVSKNPIMGSAAERSAFNEVFAHAALLRHKNIVSYYNAWVEADRVFIQSEFCEGGSLAELIEKKRAEGERFTESELKRLLLHIAKGLEHFHLKGLVHLDIKPENILLTHEPSSPDTTCVSSEAAMNDDDGSDCHMSHAEEEEDPLANVDIAAALRNEDAIPDVQDVSLGFLEKSSSSRTSSHSAPCTPRVHRTDIIPPGTPSANCSTPRSSALRGVTKTPTQPSRAESTDSGTHSGPDFQAPSADKVVYKIGDLGHVAMVTTAFDPEEGDCRYMAPEMLAENDLRRRPHLPKADIFSLGMTLYECASLKKIPRNSSDGEEYSALKNGQLPYIDGYSNQFNQLIRSMVTTNPMSRPSSQRLVRHPLLSKLLINRSKSNTRLTEELRIATAKLQLLQESVRRFKAKVSMAKKEDKSLV